MVVFFLMLPRPPMSTRTDTLFPYPTLVLSCHFDMKVPEARRQEICDLLAHANERLWLGHFDLMAEEGAVMFRHTIPLRGLPGASVEQLEDLVEARSEEQTSELQSLMRISYAVFCLKKRTHIQHTTYTN